MKSAIAAALVALLAGAACMKAVPDEGDDDPGLPGNPGDPEPGDPGDGTGPITEVSGRISTNTTWMDTIHVIGTVTVDPGVTLTVKPGTTVDVTTSKGYGISVSGVLDIQGTRDHRVVFRSATVGEFWSDVSVLRGGVLTASYLVQTGGGIGIASTAKVTLVDTQMSHSGGDFLVMSGGSLDMSYSQIGLELGQRDTTHCDMHVSGPVSIKVTHSNLSTSAYGIMFYGGNAANFTYNNWFGNGIDVDTNPAYPVTGDFSYSYFAKGAPTNPGVTALHLASARIADAGVR